MAERRFSRILRNLANDSGLRKDVERALFVAGNAVATDARISITRGSTSGKNHVPSAPGQPPNNDTGVLAANIETNIVAPFKVQVTANASYAAPLEFGTSRMAARPFMAPAANAKRPEIEQLVTRAVDKAIRRAFRGARASGNR